MSQTGNQFSNLSIHRSTANGATGGLKPENLAHVPDAGSRVGMGRYRQTPASDESYFLQARMQGRDSHKERVQRQINEINEVMRK
ncbi:hypothetical protein VTN00DRAFT_3155 [Thermoascus crustaceus]|uniref:uncharacterized protein n=1 Tax=Thermoascus crustaceus TaxID=5088 RepID=UPI003743FFC5